MTFSVLICTYNRHDMLRQALTALIDRTDQKPDEVVVVNGGTSEASQVVNEFAGRHGVCVKLIETTNVNLATSRNLGLEHCTGEIVAMTDDDAEVFPNWVSQMKRIHDEHPEAGAVGGKVVGADSQNDLISRLSDLVTFPLPTNPARVRNLPGVNVSYKGIVLKQVGKQDVTLFRGEDVDFNWRVQQLGYSVFFHPDIGVLHHHRPGLRKFFRQHYMYGRAYYLVRRKWVDMYSVYPRHFRSLRDYLKLANFFVATIYVPAQTGMKLKTWGDRIIGIPILMVNHLLWKYGMVYQMLLEKNRDPSRGS